MNQNHVCHLKGLWDSHTFSTVQQISCLNSQESWLPYIQSIAKAAVFFYSAKTMNSTAEVKAIEILLKRYKTENVNHKKCPGKEDVEVLERTILKSIMRTTVCVLDPVGSE